MVGGCVGRAHWLRDRRRARTFASPRVAHSPTRRLPLSNLMQQRAKTRALCGKVQRSSLTHNVHAGAARASMGSG
jgi:hypothetical protein